MNGSLLPSVMVHRIFDDQLKLPPTDLCGEMRVKANALEKQAKDVAATVEAARIPNTRPSLALDRYAGAYTDSLYGEECEARTTSAAADALAQFCELTLVPRSDHRRSLAEHSRFVHHDGGAK